MEAQGGRMYSSYSFTISALDGGEWSASRPGRALPPLPIGQEAGWAPGTVWTHRKVNMKITAINSKQINFYMNYMDTPVILGV
jgi:hypothetical protein